MVNLNPRLVENVLTGMGLSERPAHDVDGLSKLYSAWCHNIPFDNCRKLIACRQADPRPLPGDDPEDFFEAWLNHRVGGTCWSVHGAWFALLVALGFKAHRAVSTMVVAPNLPPNHGTVIATIEGANYWVDVGIGFVKPLAIVRGQKSSVDHPAWGVQGHWIKDKFAVRWRSLHLDEPFDCRIDEWPVDEERFRVQHEMTREWSPFNYQLNFNIARNGGRVGVGMGESVRIGPDGVLKRKPIVDRLAYLVDELGVSEELAKEVPPDIPTPPPPGTAAAMEQSD